MTERVWWSGDSKSLRYWDRDGPLVCDLTTGPDALTKRQHRRDVSQWLTHGGHAIVRVNSPATPFCSEDLDEILGSPGLIAVMVPDVRVPAAIRLLGRRLAPSGVGVIAEIASAEGVVRAVEIAATGVVDRLAFCSSGYASDIGVTASDRTLLYPRSAVVAASRAVRIEAPVEMLVSQTASRDGLNLGIAAVVVPAVCDEDAATR